MSDWQLIKTAPKDGTIILGCQGAGDDYQVFEIVWRETYGWQDPQWDGGFNPSHWMPRPSPPAKSSNAS